MTYAADTRVSVTRSRVELEELVRRHGATSIITGEMTEEGFAFVGFRLNDRNLLLKVPEPSLDDMPKKSAGGRKRTEAQRCSALEQLRRSRWRLLLLATKAKLELIAAGQSSVESEFLGDIVVRGTRTLGEELRPQLDAMGKAPPMLPAPPQCWSGTPIRMLTFPGEINPTCC